MALAVDDDAETVCDLPVLLCLESFLAPRRYSQRYSASTQSASALQLVELG